MHPRLDDLDAGHPPGTGPGGHPAAVVPGFGRGTAMGIWKALLTLVFLRRDQSRRELAFLLCNGGRQ